MTTTFYKVGIMAWLLGALIFGFGVLAANAYIEIPIIDSSNFDELYNEALQRVPSYSPEWTDHNTSEEPPQVLTLFNSLSDRQLATLMIDFFNRINKISDSQK